MRANHRHERANERATERASAPWVFLEYVQYVAACKRQLGVIHGLVIEESDALAKHTAAATTNQPINQPTNQPANQPAKFAGHQCVSLTRNQLALSRHTAPTIEPPRRHSSRPTPLRHYWPSFKRTAHTTPPAERATEPSRATSRGGEESERMSERAKERKSDQRQRKWRNSESAERDR